MTATEFSDWKMSVCSNMTFVPSVVKFILTIEHISHRDKALEYHLKEAEATENMKLVFEVHEVDGTPNLFLHFTEALSHIPARRAPSSTFSFRLIIPYGVDEESSGCPFISKDYTSMTYDQACDGCKFDRLFQSSNPVHPTVDNQSMDAEDNNKDSAAS